MSDDAIHVRIASSLKKQILDLVDAGEYRDMTDFVTKAIRNQLEYEPIENFGRFKEIFLTLLHDDDEEMLRDSIIEVVDKALDRGIITIPSDFEAEELQKQLNDIKPVVEWAKKKMEEEKIH